MGLGGPLVRDEKAETTAVAAQRISRLLDETGSPLPQNARRPLGQQDNFREVSSWQRRATARATLLRIAFAIVLDPKPAQEGPSFHPWRGRTWNASNILQ